MNNVITTQQALNIMGACRASGESCSFAHTNPHWWMSYIYDFDKFTFNYSYCGDPDCDCECYDEYNSLEELTNGNPIFDDPSELCWVKTS